MQSAVLEFDEAVQVPWRPPLAVVSDTGRVPHRRAAAAVSRPSVPRRPSPGASEERRRPVVRPAATPRTVHRPAASRSAGDRSVRLTRRGRWLLIVLSLAAGVALGALLNSWAGAAGQGSLRLAGESSVVVQPGDSLWSIATVVAGTDDVRTVVDRIQQLNHLHGTAVRPGQVLQLP